MTPIKPFKISLHKTWITNYVLILTPNNTNCSVSRKIPWTFNMQSWRDVVSSTPTGKFGEYPPYAVKLSHSEV